MQLPCTIVQSEIAQHLSQQKSQYDLITFSSALHHLQNITEVLTLAYQSLVPGGLVFTVFDPTAKSLQKTLTKLILRLDYFAFKVVKQPGDLPSAFIRRILRTRTNTRTQGKQDLEMTDANTGVLAEYHVDEGIDDLRLVSNLQAIGYQVVWHHRYSSARFFLIKKLVNWMGDATSFKLLLKKPSDLDPSLLH